MRLKLPTAVMALLAACSAGDKADEAPPPPPPTYADFAGHWRITSALDGATDSIDAELISNPIGTEWNLKPAGRGLVPIRSIGMRAESLILVSGKYPSPRRANAMMQVRIATLLVGGELQGRLVATYDFANAPQELVTGTAHGVKLPR